MKKSQESRPRGKEAEGAHTAGSSPGEASGRAEGRRQGDGSTRTASLNKTPRCSPSLFLLKKKNVLMQGRVIDFI